MTDHPKVLDFLNSIIPHKNWFIAGGYVAYDMHYNDVDIFFHSKTDFDAARNAFLTYGTNPNVETDNAVTFVIGSYKRDIYREFQLISRNFGTPDQIFETFDLNRSKQALLPNGHKHLHPTALDPLTITNVDYGSFTRLVKYLNREIETYSPDQIEHLFISLIDQYITDTTELDVYYGPTPSDTLSSPLNLRLVSAIRSLRYNLNFPYTHPQDEVLGNIQNHLNTQLLQHAPELLL